MTGSERWELLCDIGWSMHQLALAADYSVAGVRRWFDDRPGKRANPPPEIERWLIDTAAKVMVARVQLAGYRGPG